MRRFVSPTGVEIVMGDEAARAVGYKPVAEKKGPFKGRGKAKPPEDDTESDD